MPKFTIHNEFIPVSMYFIENHLKDVPGIFLKVYLYALSLAGKDINLDINEIAQALDILESDVLKSFTYWKEAGMIIEENGIIEFLQKPLSHTQNTVFNQNIENQVVDTNNNYDSIAIAKRLSDNQSLSELVILTEDLMAKPLTPQELETLFWFHDELCFSTEAILLILDYCISRNKKNMNYIEKVAISWHENGIKTTEQIMEYIESEEKKNSVFYRLQKAMSIADRALSPAEEEYIKKWLEEYKTSDEMILYAYELCILNTTKLSFPYMDKIISRWNTQGIKTLDEAKADNKNFKNKSSASFNAFEDSFDHDTLEHLTQFSSENN